VSATRTNTDVRFDCFPPTSWVCAEIRIQLRTSGFGVDRDGVPTNGGKIRTCGIACWSACPGRSRASRLACRRAVLARRPHLTRRAFSSRCRARAVGTVLTPLGYNWSVPPGWRRTTVAPGASTAGMRAALYFHGKDALNDGATRPEVYHGARRCTRWYARSARKRAGCVGSGGPPIA
jgi:hypothetical protein